MHSPQGDERILIGMSETGIEDWISKVSDAYREPPSPEIRHTSPPKKKAKYNRQSSKPSVVPTAMSSQENGKKEGPRRLPGETQGKGVNPVDRTDLQKKDNMRNSQRKVDTGDKEQTPTVKSTERAIEVSRKDQEGAVQALNFSAGKPGRDPLAYNNGPSPFSTKSHFPLSSADLDSASRPSSMSKSREITRSSKTSADLSIANIKLISFEDPFPSSFSIKELIEDIQASAAGREIIPYVVKDKLSVSTVNRVWDENITNNYHLSDEAALQELKELQKIVRAAIFCRDEGLSEPEWNHRVYLPILNLALANSHVKLWIATTASIIPLLVPRNTVTGDKFTSRKVDLCMTVDVKSSTVSQLLYNQPEQLQSLNQTLYSPLRYRPIAIAIETKMETSATTGEQQLAIWTRAWLNRIKLFRVSEIPPLPLIRIVGFTAMLLIAWEEPKNPEISIDDGKVEESTLNIQAELVIGDVRSCIGAYKLVKCIRLLARWAEGPFGEWFEKEVIAMLEQTPESILGQT